MTVESDNFFPVRRPEVAARSEPFANHDPRAVWRVLRGLVRARLGDEHVGPSGAVDTKHPTPPRRAHRHRCGPCWRAHPSPARGSCTPVCRARARSASGAARRRPRTNRTPANRASLDELPNQRHPSVVCARSRMSVGAPSFAVHLLCTSCVIGRRHAAGALGWLRSGAAWLDGADRTHRGCGERRRRQAGNAAAGRAARASDDGPAAPLVAGAAVAHRC